MLQKGKRLLSVSASGVVILNISWYRSRKVLLCPDTFISVANICMIEILMCERE